MSSMYVHKQIYIYTYYTYTNYCKLITDSWATSLVCRRGAKAPATGSIHFHTQVPRRLVKIPRGWGIIQAMFDCHFLIRGFDICLVDGFLVGGAITVLKNMSSSMGRMTSHIWNVKWKCLKPPTSFDICGWPSFPTEVKFERWSNFYGSEFKTTLFLAQKLLKWLWMFSPQFRLSHSYHRSWRILTLQRNTCAFPLEASIYVAIFQSPKAWRSMHLTCINLKNPTAGAEVHQQSRVAKHIKLSTSTLDQQPFSPLREILFPCKSSAGQPLVLSSLWFLQWRGKGARNVGFRRCAATLWGAGGAATLPGAGGAVTLRRCDAATAAVAAQLTLRRCWRCDAAEPERRDAATRGRCCWRCDAGATRERRCDAGATLRRCWRCDAAMRDRRCRRCDAGSTLRRCWRCDAATRDPRCDAVGAATCEDSVKKP